MGIGYGLKGFAGGFATGIGLGMENKKIKMIKEEQERAEKLAKEKEENAMDWYNTNKDTLVNFQTQPQDTRNMLIFESTRYSDDWNDYLRDMENAKQAGDFEELKHLNDIAEEKIKAERDMLGFGVTAENGFIGKHYTEEDMNYVKKLRMGALTNKPIGTQMYEQEFGGLPPETKEITFNEKRFNWKIEQHNQGGITLNQLLESEGISMSPEKATGLEKSIQDIKTEGARAGIDQTKINKAIQDKILGTTEEKVTPEGEVTAGEKRGYDMASSVMFGSSDWVTGISKPGIISQNISNKLNMGQSLTEEENTEVRNNYNTIKDTLPDEVKSIIESQLQRYGISLEVSALPQPIIEGLPISKPEDKPGILQKGIDKAKGMLGIGGVTKTEEIPTEIPTPKLPIGAKEAMIPTMTKKELEDAIKGLDPSDPMYKLLYDEAIKRGYITK